MYVIDEDDHLLRYSFTPGWFDEIEVKNVTIKWNDFNVIKTNSTKREEGYLIWNASLSFGEKINASVSYNLDAFNTNKDEQYVENEGTETKVISGWVIVLIVISTIIILTIIIGVIIYKSDDSDSGGGSGGSHHTTVIYTGSSIHTHSSSSSSCACVSSCACACACASSGRAGCSKKDFYGTKLNKDMLLEVFEERIIK